jgi:DNA-binding transcriptional ArsR family regulator
LILFSKRYNVLYITEVFSKRQIDTQYKIMDKGHTEKDKYVANVFNEYKDFIKDKHVLFVIKKTERIVYGAYMLSHGIPSTEVLYSDIKKTSHVLLQLTSQFVHTNYITEVSLAQVHASLQHLSSLLTLAYMETYISQANVEIMKHEINYLHKHIEELSTHANTEHSGISIKSEQFVVHQPRTIATQMSFKKSPAPIKPAQPQIKSPASVLNEKPALNQVSFKKPQPQQPPKTHTGESRDLSIIKVIQDKGDVSIKDISTVIFDVSEKTIQRTLQALIDKGQIIKEGERRWARYRLK